MNWTKEEEAKRLQILKNNHGSYKWLHDASTRYFGHLSIADRTMIERGYYGAEFVIDSGGNKKEVEEALQNIACQASSKLLNTGEF